MAKTTKTAKTAKTVENTTTFTEEMYFEHGKTIGASKTDIIAALDMAGGDFEAAKNYLDMVVKMAASKRKVSDKIKTERNENKEKDRAELERIFKLAFPNDKETLPGYLSSIRDEERYTKVKGEKVLANRLVGIRFHRDGMDMCFQAFVPVARKRGNIAKTSKEVKMDVDNTLVTLIKSVILTHKD